MGGMSKFDCVRKLDAEGFDSDMLNDMVHDAASSLASDANKGGMLEQVWFLHETCGWSYEDIVKAARKEA